MKSEQDIIDAEFEVLHGPDRSTGKLEAWQVEPGQPIPPYPSLKARLRYYGVVLAKTAGVIAGFAFIHFFARFVHGIVAPLIDAVWPR